MPQLIDRSGSPESLAAIGMKPDGTPIPGWTGPASGSLYAAQPVPPTGQAKEGYPPASPTQASSQGPAGAAPPILPSAGGGAGRMGGGGGMSKMKGNTPAKTPRSIIKNADPLAIEDTLEGSLEAVNNTAKNNPQAFKQIDAALTLKGVDTRKAFEDLRDNLIDDAAARRSGRKGSKIYNEKEFKKRWKNVFNIIPEDRMGMFLVDFGMRMLAVSTQPGNALAHMGMAGMGSLAQMKGEMALEEQQGLEAERYASEEARSIMGMEQDAQAGALRAGELALSTEKLKQDISKGNRINPDDIVWTTQGAMYDDGTGLKPLRDQKGGALRPDPRYGRNGQYERPYESDIRYNRLRQAGYDHKRATDMLEGAPTEAEARLRASDDFSSLADKKSSKYPSPIDGTRKYLVDFTEKERQAWINQRVSDVFGTQAGAGAARPQRPAAMDDPRYNNK